MTVGAFIKALFLRIAFACVIVVLVAMLAACAFGQTPAQSVTGGHGAAPALTQPLVVLLDTSSSMAPAAVQLQLRNRLSQLLRDVPEGTSISVWSFSSTCRLLGSGHVSTAEVLALFDKLDHQPRRSGRTDLGSALEHLPHGSQSYDAVILSDFFLNAPPRSNWSKATLSDILAAAHGGGARRLLLLPIGAANQISLAQLPSYVTVVPKEERAMMEWTRRLVLSPPSLVVSHPVAPFWKHGSFVLATVLMAIVFLGAVVSFRHHEATIRNAERLALITAAPDAEPEESTLEEVPSMAPPIVRLWHVLVLETGLDVPIARRLKIGAGTLSDLQIDSARSTLILDTSEKHALRILNRGNADVHIGRFPLAANSSIEIPYTASADCIIAPGHTLRFYAEEGTYVCL